LIATLHENKEAQGIVNAIEIKGNTFIYIKGRSLFIHDILDKLGKPKRFQRDSLLKSCALNNDGSIIALGDDYGKIYIVHNGKQMIVQTLHWHSHKVNTLRFIP
jgi:hypothetical protein